MPNHPGSRNTSAKLNETQVVEIKKRLAAGELHRIIAADYGMHESAISKIKLGIRWRSVQGE